MGADIKALKTRIRSVDSTLHLTRAMGLVASSKMRRANERMNRGRAFAGAFDDVIRVLASSPECARSAYMQKREGGTTELIVIAGDRGLAGGYNANVFRAAAEIEDTHIRPIGKRACERYGGEFVSSEHFSSEQAAAWAKELCADFRTGKFNRLEILYTGYVSLMTQEPQVLRVLPLEKTEREGGAAPVFEPDEQTVLETAVPDYVAGSLMRAVRESFASEVAARRMAMDSAGKNAQAMIDRLQLEYNRARQNAITQEITEIVAGSDGV